MFKPKNKNHKANPLESLKTLGTSTADKMKEEAARLPEDFMDHTPFTLDAAHKAIGNAVALPMARELGRAVREALEQ